jgi:hypothetical protein
MTSSSAAEFSPRVRRLVRDRAEGTCECCAIWLPPGYGQLQHRVARGMGGSRNPLLGSAANGLLLCGTPASGCHGLAESRDEDMHQMGMWLRSYEDPLVVPVRLHGQADRWLTLDGDYSTRPPRAGAA